MTDLTERLRKNTRCMGHGDYDVDPLSLEAADEIDRLRRYEWVVKFIVTDQLELSYEKIENQRTWWKKLCKQLIEEDNE